MQDISGQVFRGKLKIKSGPPGPSLDTPGLNQQNADGLIASCLFVVKVWTINKEGKWVRCLGTWAEARHRWVTL